MRHRLWINVALLAAVTVLGLFAWLKPRDGAPENKLSPLKTSEADSVQLHMAGSDPVVMERSGAQWRIVTPVNLRADNFQVQRLLGILDATSKDRFPPVGLARYDLNEPRARLVINKQSFSFGAINEMSREQYVLTQDGVFLIPVQHGAALPKNALQLVSKQLFAVDEAPVAFEFDHFKVVQRDGTWQLTPPSEGGADDINRWADEWRLATALDILPASRRKSAQVIKVTLKGGMDVTLSVLEQDSSLVLARSDQPVEYRFAGAMTKRLLAAPTAASPTPAPAK